MFERVASYVARIVEGPAFFTAALLAVLAWSFSYPLFGDADTWQLVINTATTIVTFLLVSLLQNTQARFERDTNARLQELIELVGGKDPAKENT